MKTVAIISEFNPFHNGHRYLVDEARRHFGEDTCIIALMSGNYTQRGDVAVADKFTRAAAAVAGGVDLVLEIPFPFSASSAEFFANAGVSMAASLGIVDALAFGSESGDLEALSEVAAGLLSPAFDEALQKALSAFPECGHPALVQRTYAALYGEAGAALLSDPNNILAIRYLVANRGLSTPLEVFTVKRRGGYHDPSLGEYASASAIRHALTVDRESASPSMPPASSKILQEAVASGIAPAHLDRLGSILLSFFRLAPCREGDDIGHRLHAAALRAADFEEFLTLVATKRYTNAHLRRTMWHRYFGITSADLRSSPAYTQILGANAKGRAALRRASRLSSIALLTKPADARALPEEAARQAAVSQRADLLYPLAMPTPVAGDSGMKAAPYCEK